MSLSSIHKPSRGAGATKNNPAIINTLLGLWLFLSSVLWTHSRPQVVNALVVGAVIVAASLASMRRVAARYAATAASIWLLLSCWALPMGSLMTFWNNLVVAFAVFFLSLIVPEQHGRTTGPATSGE